MIRALALCLLVLASAARAADLVPPPGAMTTVTEARPLDALRVATGPFDGTLPAVSAEGGLTRTVWRVPEAETTLAVLAPLRAQLLASGWTVVLDCAARACGGFEFRFEIDVTPAPEMFVDLADYRYLSARRGDAWTTLVVSLSNGTGYVEATRVQPGLPPGGGAGEAEAEAGAEALPRVATPSSAPVPAPASASAPNVDVARALREVGHAVLTDLDFASGSTALTGDDYPSLAALAAFMDADPDVTVALVGHTDATGAAAGNLAISLRRAETARALLIRRHGIAAGRLETRGVGYFAPVAGNATDAGRRTNRRVEAVVTSTR